MSRFDQDRAATLGPLYEMQGDPATYTPHKGVGRTVIIRRVQQDDGLPAGGQVGVRTTVSFWVRTDPARQGVDPNSIDIGADRFRFPMFPGGVDREWQIVGTPGVARGGEFQITVR